MNVLIFEYVKSGELSSHISILLPTFALLLLMFFVAFELKAANDTDFGHRSHQRKELVCGWKETSQMGKKFFCLWDA